MSDQVTNLSYDQSKPSAKIRQEAIAALESGHDYVLIVVKPKSNDCDDLEVMTSLGVSDIRQCVDFVQNDLKYVRPGMSN